MRIRKFEAPPRQCDYLPEQISKMVYAEVDELTPEQYLQLIHSGWRRFGYWLFRPECPSCRACQPIRVPVRDFKANRSQRRIIKQNAGVIKLVVGGPVIDDARIRLYVDHHEHHAETRGWRPSEEGTTVQSIRNFTESPLPIQEWAFYLQEELVAIAYVDQLPNGYSGIYFYHSPAHRKYSLGNWICISMIQRAQELGFDYVYFGYYIKGNISMEYKAAFAPNQILHDDGIWHDFISG